MSDLHSYFDRIGYRGDTEPTLATLSALLGAHVFRVPFENLDIQLGRPVPIEIEHAYSKIVERGRGGWCYEQNGLFGWVLSALGFEVTRVAANVLRQQHGDSSAASHLSLLVGIPGQSGRYLADVGFGGSMIAPIALAEGEYRQPPFRIGLRSLDDGHWRFWENDGSGEFTFDFLAEPADESALAAKCLDLQSDPSSSFVLNLVAQLREPQRHKTLRGRVYSVTTAAGTEKYTLETPQALTQTLESEFGLDVGEVTGLWARIVARHEEVIRQKRGTPS